MSNKNKTVSMLQKSLKVASNKIRE